MHTPEYFMKQALKEAKKAYEKEEIPIGAVIVKDDKIISRAYNKREEKMQATAHSEILAIEKACKKLNNWRLIDCDIYVTVEPCPMCAGAILNSRMKKLYFGANDEKSGAVTSNIRLFDKEYLNHIMTYEEGVLKEECQDILVNFFKKRRK